MPNKLTRYGIRLTPVNGVWAHAMIEADDGEFVRYSDVVQSECKHHWSVIHVHVIHGPVEKCLKCGVMK